MSHLHNDLEPSPALISGDAWLHWQRLHPHDAGARARWHITDGGHALTYESQR